MSQGSDPPVVCEVYDLSMAGIFVRCTERLAAGTPCTVQIQLLAGSPAVHFEGRVMRVHDEGMGIAITSLDAKNARHLESIIAYNTRRSDLL